MAAAVRSPWVVCHRSPVHGRGLRARRPIPAGTRVIEYLGERITKAESARRELARLERQKRGRPASVFIFNLNRRQDLDGDLAGNLARWINHSCEPNCRSENIRGRIWIIARRDIAEGEELSFDYGYPLAEWSLHPCLCGTASCPGYIVAKPQRRRLLRRLKARARSQSSGM